MKIVEDNREIESIVLESPYSFSVGEGGIESIKPYQENGEMAAITWFAVYAADKIIARVSSRYVVAVYYKSL